MWQAVSNGWIPPEDVSEIKYIYASQNREITPEIGFIGFGCSYSGKWFGGYARGNDSAGTPRNYASESSRNIQKQSKGLIGVEFRCGSYSELIVPKNSIIYCDPPYKGTTKYSFSGNFDHDEFWKWCNEKVNEGHDVFVSEYSAPNDWACIWEKKVNNTLAKDTGSKQGVEKLFVHKSKEELYVKNQRTT